MTNDKQQGENKPSKRPSGTTGTSQPADGKGRQSTPSDSKPLVESGGARQNVQCYNEVVKSLKTLQDTDKRFVKIRWRHRAFGWLTRAFDDSLALGEPANVNYSP